MEKAEEMCTQPFQNTDIFGDAVEEMMKLLGREWYEVVSPEELAAIKAAMVSGLSGIYQPPDQLAPQARPSLPLSRLIPYFLRSRTS
jgi:hypothetical protein